MSYYTTFTEILLFESYCKKNQVDGLKIDAEVGGNPLKLTVATTPKTQMAGYQNFKSEPIQGEGILFIYDTDEPRSFWMKNVKFPLDVIFFDSNLNYIGHETMSPGDSIEDADLPKYTSKEPARFAVEVKAGWADKNISKGCKLSF